MVENKAGKIRERWEKRGGCAISQGVVRKGLTDKVALEQILEAARCAGMWGDEYFRQRKGPDLSTCLGRMKSQKSSLAETVRERTVENRVGELVGKLGRTCKPCQDLVILWEMKAVGGGL